MIIIDRIGNLMIPTQLRDKPNSVHITDWPKQKFVPVNPVIAAVRRAIRG